MYMKYIFKEEKNYCIFFGEKNEDRRNYLDKKNVHEKRIVCILRAFRRKTNAYVDQVPSTREDVESTDPYSSRGIKMRSRYLLQFTNEKFDIFLKYIPHLRKCIHKEKRLKTRKKFILQFHITDVHLITQNNSETFETLFDWKNKE